MNRSKHEPTNSLDVQWKQIPVSASQLVRSRTYYTIELSECSNLRRQNTHQLRPKSLSLRSGHRPRRLFRSPLSIDCLTVAYSRHPQSTPVASHGLRLILPSSSTSTFLFMNSGYHQISSSSVSVQYPPIYSTHSLSFLFPPWLSSRPLSWSFIRYFCTS